MGVGFGIRDAQTAQAIGEFSDAVVIGSRIIEMLNDQPHEKVVPLTIDFLRGVRKALDA
ncbi:tryptophan synthase subunit alpha [compost metagenome]